MTLLERYNQEKTWQGKVEIMEIYYLAMSQKEKGWTISKTAEYFKCSTGLVSENLHLAQAFHSFPSLLECEFRQHALDKLNGVK